MSNAHAATITLRCVHCPRCVTYEVAYLDHTLNGSRWLNLPGSDTEPAIPHPELLPEPLRAAALALPPITYYRAECPEHSGL